MTFGAETRCSHRQAQQPQLPFPLPSIALKKKKPNASQEVGTGRRESAPPGRKAGQAHIWVVPALDAPGPVWSVVLRGPGRLPAVAPGGGWSCPAFSVCSLFCSKEKHVSSYRPRQPRASSSKLGATSAGIFGIYFCVIWDSSVIFQKYIIGPAACLLCKYCCPIIIIIMILTMY